MEMICNYPACTRTVINCSECNIKDLCKIHHDWGYLS